MISTQQTRRTLSRNGETGTSWPQSCRATCIQAVRAGLAFAALNRLDEAVAEFKTQAVQRRPDYAEAHYSLGVAYFQLGRKQAAEEQRMILVKLNLSSPQSSMLL
ncbi:MAG TPA: tetratricopeptide repeat protein [Pyrinomonadaceae bacterium]|nr:tetratricopeptide repeat protein [Pyrinomonadaceae bacterium]